MKVGKARACARMPQRAHAHATVLYMNGILNLIIMVEAGRFALY